MGIEKLVMSLYGKRPESSRKGDFGKLLIIGGSQIYTGAPALCALAALRSGCDLASIAAPQRAADIAASFSPNIITYPLKGSLLHKSHVPEILRLCESANAIVIGPGLGKDRKTLDTASRILSKISIPAVIDADAILAAGRNPEVIVARPFVVTCHAREFKDLTGEALPERFAAKKDTVKNAALRLKTTILLKNPVDLISDGSKVFENKTGNAYMTKGGTGDILAGICGAILARGAKPIDAACAAAYISGKSGEIASKIYSEGLLATDVVESIPRILSTIT